MCGIFAYISKRNTVDVDLLKAIAIDTERRGPHAFGFAWLEADNKMRMYKQEGRVSDESYMLDLCGQARVLIGHCRWATRGNPDDYRNNHPHECGSGYLVHNGTILRHQDVVRQKRLRVRTECDSEILCKLYERKRKGDALEKLARVIDAVDHKNNEIALAGIWNEPAKMAFFRRGKPLHFSETRDGIYIASYGTALPGKAYALTENKVFQMQWNKKHQLETWQVTV